MKPSQTTILTQNKGLQTGNRLFAELLPGQDCLLCGTASGSQLICSECETALPRLPAERCPQCAQASPQGHICGRCLTKTPHFDATLADFCYDFPLARLVQSYKYEHRLILGPWFGIRLAKLAQSLAADLIIPLPLHPERLRERGFNQALELARPVSQSTGVPLDSDSCLRIRHTQKQADLPWRERSKNIRGAFHCSRDFSGKRIILVDDVLTTGASLNECARTLKLHGAMHVTALVVARAVTKPN